MESTKSNSRFFILLGMVLAASFVRLIPHPPNFAPIMAVALFSGAYFVNKKFAYTIPIIAMFLTDMIIGFHTMMIAVYFSFVLIVFLGSIMLKKVKFTNVFAATVIASLVFFLITNFSVWAMGTIYPKSFAGLATCYTAAIPFFNNSLAGNLFYVTLMFGAFEFIKVKFPKTVGVNA